MEVLIDQGRRALDIPFLLSRTHARVCMHPATFSAAGACLKVREAPRTREGAGGMRGFRRGPNGMRVSLEHASVEAVLGSHESSLTPWSP